MPNYLDEPAIIDWHYPEVDPLLHVVIQDANANLSSPYHSLITVEEQIRAVASEHPTLVIDALAEGVLFRARNGVVEVIETYRVNDPAITALVQRLESRSFDTVPPPPLTSDRTFDQALYWKSDMLDDIQREATRLNTSLSKTVEAAWRRVRDKVAASERDDLAPMLSSYGGDKCKQTLILAGDILAEIQDQATRLDSSLSFVVQCAWAVDRGVS